MSARDSLEGPRSAVAAGEWQRALDLLDDWSETAPHSDSEDRAAERLELRAQAAYGAGDFEASVNAWEDLHAFFVDRGEPMEAARAAAMVAMFLLIDTGLMAPIRGWLRRADRLLDGQSESAADAILAMVRSYERLFCGDLDAARQHAGEAIELGDRLGVMPAVVVGRVAAARVKIFEGEVAEGLGLLDEVCALLMSNEVDPLTTGMMYCELICAAQGLALHDLACEWTEVMERWRHGAAFGGINGRCRVHRAELLRISGPCDAAEAEALAACDELRPWMRREFGWPLVELGNIRLRRGDLDGAEEAFLAAHEHAWSPLPGLALLRLAQGDATTAARLIAEEMANPQNIPWKERPPCGDLRMAPLLDAQSEIAAATGDVDAARQAAEALTEIAACYPSRWLSASAELAAARAAVLSDDFGPAAQLAASAIERWTDIGAPFEAAAARLVLGEVHERAGRDDAARGEWKAAQAAFAAFGAERLAARAERLATGLAPESASAPQSTLTGATPPATAVFERSGDTRTVCFGGTTAVVSDLKGHRYIERLLADPGREFHVLDLVAVEQGSLPTGRRPSGDVDLISDGVGGGLPALDQQAIDSYRRRLAEVEEDIEEATQRNDLGRVELAQRDRDYLVAEITRAVGLGGHRRASGGTTERARTAVTRSIRYALGRLAEHHPTVAEHLEHCVQTGTYCAYTPDPLATITWEL